MPLPLIPLIGLGASALGSFLGNRAQGQRNRQLQSMFGSPSALEQWGQSMLWGGQGFNTGQDGLMQGMRRDPLAQSNNALAAIIDAQGNPFDTSELFQSLGVLDNRNLTQSLAGLSAAAPGLGSRFGTANRNAEVRLREQALQDAAARNAGIAMQSHGDAQGRLLQALGLSQQGALGQQAQQNQLLQLLLGAQAQRQGLLAGQPATSPFGSFLGDLGSATLIPDLFGRRGLQSPQAQFFGLFNQQPSFQTMGPR